jgi:hypothetical protein
MILWGYSQILHLLAEHLSKDRSGRSQGLGRMTMEEPIYLAHIVLITSALMSCLNIMPKPIRKKLKPGDIISNPTFA